MDKDEIIRMAREAGFKVYEGAFPFEPTEDNYIGFEDNLERFAALVADHEREKLLHQIKCDDDFPEGFDASIGIPAQALRTANAAMFDLIDKREWDVPCVAMHIIRYAEAAVLAEREACAKVCEEMYDLHEDDWDYCVGLVDCVAAIRARGENGTA